MLKRIMLELVLLLSLTLMILAVATWSSAPWVDASSHREAPLISKDPAVDNLDLYVFRSPDVSKTVTLISNWIPFEEPAGGPNFYHFDDLAYYWIKIDRDGDGVEDISYLWTFSTRIQNPNTFLYNTGPISVVTDSTYNYRQYYTVTEYLKYGQPGQSSTVLFANQLMPPDNIGIRSTPNYASLRAQSVHSAAGDIKEFTGQRDDPFYVDIGSIFDLGALRPFNAAHLIPKPAAPGQDNLAGFNMHTTALQLPITRLAPDCPVDAAGLPISATAKSCVIGVWSTAERPKITTRGTGSETGSGGYQQVSRLGNPLVNEAVIPLGLKDAFNAIPPTVDKTVPQAVASVYTPELGVLIPILYPGITVPKPPRNDLFTVFLTGIPGLNEQTNSKAQPSELLRLNMAIAPTGGVCAGASSLGVIAGDNAGWPNGRRLEDDVTDVALRAVAGGYAFTPDNNRAPNNALGDGVNTNDKPCLTSFPYMADPTSGYESPHSKTGSTQPPIVPELTTMLMFGSGLAGLAGYGIARARAARAARRRQT